MRKDKLASYQKGYAVSRNQVAQLPHPKSELQIHDIKVFKPVTKDYFLTPTLEESSLIEGS